MTRPRTVRIATNSYVMARNNLNGNRSNYKKRVNLVHVPFKLMGNFIANNRWVYNLNTNRWTLTTNNLPKLRRVSKGFQALGNRVSGQKAHLYSAMARYLNILSRNAPAENLAYNTLMHQGIMARHRTPSPPNRRTRARRN